MIFVVPEDNVLPVRLDSLSGAHLGHFEQFHTILIDAVFALLYMHLGMYNEEVHNNSNAALRRYKAALDIIEARFGEGGISKGDISYPWAVYNDYAECLVDLGRYDEAIASLDTSTPSICAAIS